MLTHEQTMQLIAQAKEGDNAAKEKLIIENTPLLKSIIRRYVNYGVEYDDLLQISAVGLLKAINNFSTEYNVRFSTYAVPMVLGEVKRYMRDDGYIKISRSIKSLSGRIQKYIDNCEKDNGEVPSIKQISEFFLVEESEVIFALDSQRPPVSLYDKSDSTDNKGVSFIDKLADDYKEDNILDKMMLQTIINNLSDKEKQIILLRYFKDYTQTQIAKVLGISQVQVSRIENKILAGIRSQLAEK
ncbi:MAG: sigma-70 family RNA polymerase sigma factor [Clostridia bacterium]|nr:sigma-70 family RNA polymerase sigma factor [Clostridia bacterium]